MTAAAVQNAGVVPVATEGGSARHDLLDTWTVQEQLASLWEGQLAAVAAVGSALPAVAAAVEAALPRLAAGGRLAYAGAGSSGRLGAQDGAELEPTFDWPRERLLLLIAGGSRALLEAVEDAEDDEDTARDAVRDNAIGPSDVVLAVAASGGTPFTVAVARAARSAGALVIGISNGSDTKLQAVAEHAVALPTGAEPIAGSTRLRAGTAQKVVLNLISTALMTGLGRVHAGRMVDMRARNAKLRRRAVAMVRELAGVDDEAAAAALGISDGRVKPAILVATGSSAEEARTLLERHDGRLRPAMAARNRPATDRLVADRLASAGGTP